MKKIAKIVALTLGTIAPALVFAQTGTGILPGGNPSLPNSPITTIGGFWSVLGSILNVFYIIFFFLAALFIILAAFKYLTAAGDEEKLKTAKQMIIYAIIAIAVALIATGVKGIVSGFLQQPIAIP